MQRMAQRSMGHLSSKRMPESLIRINSHTDIARRPFQLKQPSGFCLPAIRSSEYPESTSMNNQLKAGKDLSHYG